MLCDTESVLVFRLSYDDSNPHLPCQALCGPAADGGEGVGEREETLVLNFRLICSISKTMGRSVFYPTEEDLRNFFY